MLNKETEGQKGRGKQVLHLKNAYTCGNRTDLNISAGSNYAEYLKFPTLSLGSDLARTEVELFDMYQKSCGVLQRCC